MAWTKFVPGKERNFFEAKAGFADGFPNGFGSELNMRHEKKKSQNSYTLLM